MPAVDVADRLHARAGSVAIHVAQLEDLLPAIDRARASSNIEEIFTSVKDHVGVFATFFYGILCLVGSVFSEISYRALDVEVTEIAGITDYARMGLTHLPLLESLVLFGSFLLLRLAWPRGFAFVTRPLVVPVATVALALAATAVDAGYKGDELSRASADEYFLLEGRTELIQASFVGTLGSSSVLALENKSGANSGLVVHSGALRCRASTQHAVMHCANSTSGSPPGWLVPTLKHVCRSGCCAISHAGKGGSPNDDSDASTPPDSEKRVAVPEGRCKCCNGTPAIGKAEVLEIADHVLEGIKNLRPDSSRACRCEHSKKLPVQSGDFSVDAYARGVLNCEVEHRFDVSGFDSGISELEYGWVPPVELLESRGCDARAGSGVGTASRGRVWVVGSASLDGSPVRNATLGQDRANYVARILKNKGCSADIRTRSVGEQLFVGLNPQLPFEERESDSNDRKVRVLVCAG